MILEFTFAWRERQSGVEPPHSISYVNCCRLSSFHFQISIFDSLLVADVAVGWVEAGEGGGVGGFCGVRRLDAALLL